MNLPLCRSAVQSSWTQFLQSTSELTRRDSEVGGGAARATDTSLIKGRQALFIYRVVHSDHDECPSISRCQNDILKTSTES